MIVRILGCALVIIFSTCVHAADEYELPTPEQIIKNVKNVYRDHCCFRAQFDQVTVNVAMDLRDRFLGTLYVRRPNLLALEVDSPERQRVVVRGGSYMVYFPDEGNAARGQVPDDINVESFISFFTDIGNLDKDFSVIYAKRPFDPTEGLFMLELAGIKDKRSTHRIVLGIDETRYTIRRAIVHDALGNYNRFDLSDITFLKSIPESRFATEPPAKQAPEPESPSAGRPPHGK